jgi:hypothetical protein
MEGEPGEAEVEKWKMTKKKSHMNWNSPRTAWYRAGPIRNAET